MPCLRALMSLRGNFNRSIKIGLQNSLKKQPFFRSLLGIGHHRRNIIEIASDIRLPDAYQLKDGDWVEVGFP